MQTSFCTKLSCYTFTVKYTEYQIISHDGKPMFAVIPYDEYTVLIERLTKLIIFRAGSKDSD
jgi:hypothetical protein